MVAERGLLHRQHARQTRLRDLLLAAAWSSPRERAAAVCSTAVTRWWRACGREGRGCGLTAATSARPGCAVQKRASPNSGLFARVESLCCESCVQCGPTVYSATRRACGRVEGNLWLLYHLANVRTLTRYTVGPDTGACTQPAGCADCSESRTLALFRSAQHTPAEHW